MMEGEEELQQVAKPIMYQAPINQYASSILTLTNPENELHKMELSFRGMILDKDGNPKQLGTSLLNEEGISSVIGQIQIIVNQVTIMSNFTKYDIPIMLDFIGDSLAKDLMMNRRTYNIKSTADRDKIFFAALGSAFITLKRGYEEGDRRFWKGSTQEITTRIEGATKKEGFLSSALGWGK